MADASSAPLLDTIRGKLVVSCQASADSPLHDVVHIVALARAAELGGASGLRLEGVENVRAVCTVTRLPIIGIVKHALPPDHAFITIAAREIEELAEAGADIVAFDATDRTRPEPVAALVDACHSAGRMAMADVSTLAEALAAMDAGADFVGTTLSGYTAGSPALETPDYGLMRELAASGIPFVAEGRIWTPDEAIAALRVGALFVVVGSAITRPNDITARFVTAIARHGQA